MASRMKLLAVLALVACAPAHALLLDTGSPQFIGIVSDGAPANPTAVATYVNSLLQMDAGDSGDCLLAPSEFCDRTGSSLDVTGFVAATAVDAVRDETGNTTGIDVTNYAYLTGKYGGRNGGGQLVWYVGNLSGVVDVQATYNRRALSNWTLFNPGTSQVPEPGSLALLGLGLVGAGAARRFRRARG